MKNLTRVLALVIVLAMMMSTVAFASFTDVAADDDYAEAIETLAALGIIKGYEDGTFGADKAITRAEAVAIVNRIQNLSLAASGAAGASLYTDVAADHWALGDINLATQMGVISGDGNGLFRPEDQVSYQEMVKMLTVALGYGPAVAENGGWPTGYLVVANNQGVLADTVNAGATAANRGVVAQLTFNALTAPIMEQTGYGDEKEYHFIDAAGNYSFTKTLLSSKLGIYKLDVVAEASDTKTLGTALAEVGKVTVNAPIDATSTIGLGESYYVNLPDDMHGLTSFVKGASTLGEDLGYRAVAYVKKNADKKYEVLYSSLDPVANKTVEISPEAVVSATGGVITIENENGVKERFYVYDATSGEDAVVIRNNVFDGLVAGSTLGEGAFTYDGEVVIDRDYLDTAVTLLYNDNQDDVVDYIFFEEYACDIVADESFDGTSIFGEQAVIDLDTVTNKGLAYDLTLDGEAITPADLKVGDVINYYSVTTGNSTYYKILVSRDVVEGSVESYIAAKQAYTIAGENYKLSNSAAASSVASNLNANTSLGKAGVFHLDAFGKIVTFKKAAGAGAVADFNYGYVKAFAVDANSLTADAKMIIMDKAGETNTYTLANTVTLAVNTYTAGEIVEDGLATNDTVTTLVGSGLSATLATDLSNNISNGDMIDFTLNADGKINSITVYPGTQITQSNDEFFAHSTGTAQYITRNNKFGTLNVTENTIIFCVGQMSGSPLAINEDEFFVTDWSILEDNINYNYTAYCVNEDNEIGALAITTNITTNSSKDAAAVFAGIANIQREDGTKTQLVSYYQNGELKTMNTVAHNTVSGLNVGDVFTFTVQKDEISSVATLGAIGYTTPAYVQGTPAYYAYGQVIDRSANKIKLGGFTQVANAYTTLDQFDTYTIPETANVYVVTAGRLEDKVEVGAMTSIFKNRFFEENGSKYLPIVEKADNYTVLIKFNKDMDITDVIAYKNFSTDNAVLPGMINATATLIAKH